MKTIKNILFALICFISFNAAAQCDTTSSLCSKHLFGGFISDGQQYRALLLDDQVAEFHSTFFGGSVYRIAACSGLKDGILIFRIFDEERNLLFSNEEQANSPFWDFEIKNTMEIIIEAQLDPTMTNSGCAVLLIGFKQ